MFRHTLTKQLQRVFWVFLTRNFVITSRDDIKIVEAACPCAFIPITTANYARVSDFREHGRVGEYLEKVSHHEIGFFAECDAKMVGSIWATVNRTRLPVVVRAYMRLMPGEALVHDIVTGEKSRGMGVGPFMIGRIASTLLDQYGAHKIVIDVNFRNKPSLRMMHKVGLEAQEQVFYVSAFGRQILEKVLKKYPHS